MSVVISFNECIARPDDGPVRFLLKDHLEAVAVACGSVEGEPADRIAFLAGLLHDAAKAHAEWQKYIREEREEGPPHAPMGAALFAYCAEQLIASWRLDRQTRRMLNDLTLDWIRVIYDHHGALDDLDEVLPPWEKSGADSHFSEIVDACDMDGIFTLVDAHLPGGKLCRDGFLEWLCDFQRLWERRVKLERGKQLARLETQAFSPRIAMAKQAWSIPRAATRLVSGDRYHAGSLKQISLDHEKAESGCQKLLSECRHKAEQSIKQGADPELVSRRQEIQQKAVETYLHNKENLFYTLLLPTGYGKTLSALRVALTACAMGRCQRIVYVAPYLSILSQNTAEITNSTGIEVMQHHHLSIAELDDDQVEATETWQAPILTTTFNQFFRAVFPRRAHQCLRIEALRGTFVIIDEPQIIATAVWNVFLRNLSAMAEELSFQVLFTTATLPPLEWGLLHPAISLSPPDVEAAGRFAISWQQESIDASDVASLAIDSIKETDSVAVVTNTVRDAAEIYKLVNSSYEKGDVHLYCLTALMLPSHKAQTIHAIREDLRKHKRVIAVCTQILEAGVDLSFRTILRAIPILPSIAQVAGRANRHGEGDRAQVIVFPLLREDGEDSRRWVYRDKTACHQTDLVLEEWDSLLEENVPQALHAYYKRCWDENRNTASLKWIEEAAKGKWSVLTGLKPFSSGPPRDSLFVDQPVEALNDIMQRLQAHFAPEGGRQLLERLQDRRFRSKLSFLDRKRFSALLQQYLVQVPKKLAQQIGVEVPVGTQDDNYLWELVDRKNYSSSTGLAHLLSPDEEQHSLIL